MKSIRRSLKVSVLLAWILMATPCLSQSWTLIRSTDLSDPVSSFSIDSDSYLYIGSEYGDLTTFDSLAIETKHYSEIANSSLTLIESWNRLKLFLFYRDLQKISILDRFSTTPADYNLSDFGVQYAWLAAPGIDNSIWMLSTDYNELKKYDLQTRQLLLSTPLQQPLSHASHLRAYQNLVIISDRKKGIFCFDQFGNLLYHHRVEGIEHFQISEGKLLFLHSSLVTLMDPFQPSEAETMKAPEGAFRGVLNSGKYYHFIKKSKIVVYRRGL